MDLIHSSSIIEGNVKLGKNVKLGPFCYLSGNITIGDNTVIESHTIIQGDVIIGANNIIGSHVSIGIISFDISNRHTSGRVIIGDNNYIGRNTSISRGTNDNSTVIGNDNLFMGVSHIAHDTNVGSNVVFAQLASTMGHVIVEDYARIGGGCAIHQKCKIGHHAYITTLLIINYDVVPYGYVVPYIISSRRDAAVTGINFIGLKRMGYSTLDIKMIKDLYHNLFVVNSDYPLTKKIELLSDDLKDNTYINNILKFLNPENRIRPLMKYIEASYENKAE